MSKWLEGHKEYAGRKYYNSDLCGREAIERQLEEIEGRCSVRKLNSYAEISYDLNRILSIFFKKGITKKEMKGARILLSKDSRVAKAYGQKGKYKAYSEIEVEYNGKRFHVLNIARKENRYDSVKHSSVKFTDGFSVIF